MVELIQFIKRSWSSRRFKTVLSVGIFTMHWDFMIYFITVYNGAKHLFSSKLELYNAHEKKSRSKKKVKKEK